MPSELRWKNATQSELYTIAYHDDAATMKDRIAAAEELKRRNRRQLRNDLQCKRKEVFPR